MDAATTRLERLPESASLLLDVMRFALALLVLLGHMSLPFFSTAWPTMLWLADAAVPGFFVLSGFMIRYVTQDRERDPRRYFISRASRMYSVLLPAIVLTLVCNTIVRRVQPGYAAGLFTDEGTLADAAHAVAHLLFFTQFWGHAVLLPPNLPLWSLGYEVPYYIFFGLLVLCRGAWRWFAAALYALLLGPQVLFLLPLWWSGCWLYDTWQWARRRGRRTRRMVVAAAASGTALLLLVLPLHGGSLWTRICLLPHPLLLLHQPTVRAIMPALASGVVAWAAMLLGLVASDQVDLPRNAAWARPVRRAAEGTFALYLFHYPLLCLIVPLRGGFALTSGLQTLLITVAIVIVCVLAALPTDALKNSMRRRLTSYFVVRPA